MKTLGYLILIWCAIATFFEIAKGDEHGKYATPFWSTVITIAIGLILYA